MGVDVDATLLVEQADTSLSPLQVATDVASPTAVALPVLDAAARLALANILVALAATLDVDDGHPDPQQNALTNTELRAAAVEVFGAVTQGGAPWTMRVQSETFTKGTITASVIGNNTVFTPAAGKKVRLSYFGFSAGAGVDGVLVQLRWGTNPPFDTQYLIAAGQPFARNIEAGDRYVEGAVDEALVVTLSAAKTVYVNYELLEV